MNTPARARQIRQIKAAGNAMFPGDEPAQRDIYEQLTGLRSCTQMTDSQLRQVGDYLARASGHKPDKPVAFRPSSSRDLAARLREFEARPAPAGWTHHPLMTRMVWRNAVGLEAAVPFEHLDSGQQSRLYRALKVIFDGRSKPRPAPRSPGSPGAPRRRKPSSPRAAAADGSKRAPRRPAQGSLGWAQKPPEPPAPPTPVELRNSP